LQKVNAPVGVLVVHQVMGTTAYLIFVAVIVGLFVWFFLRYVVGKRRLSTGTRTVGTVIFESFRNADGQEAIEEIMYIKESWQKEDGEGDDIDRHQGKPGSTSVDS
jgi:hypothetical protein